MEKKQEAKPRKGEEKSSLRSALNPKKQYEKVVLTHSAEYTIKHKGSDVVTLIDAEGKKKTMSNKDFNEALKAK